LKGSFFYWIPINSIEGAQTYCGEHDVPFQIKLDLHCSFFKKNHLAIVFPDLPIRQYAKIHARFGGEGRTFPNSL
jgi:hypothetical protein